MSETPAPVPSAKSGAKETGPAETVSLDRPAVPPAAQRALAEAEQRRKQYLAEEKRLPRELGGRKEGLEPVRYGDWEIKGLASDF